MRVGVFWGFTSKLRGKIVFYVQIADKSCRKTFCACRQVKSFFLFSFIGLWIIMASWLRSLVQFELTMDIITLLMVLSGWLREIFRRKLDFNRKFWWMIFNHFNQKFNHFFAFVFVFVFVGEGVALFRHWINPLNLSSITEWWNRESLEK